MKLLYCQDCGDLVAPALNRPRRCFCGRHAVWGTGHNTLAIADTRSTSVVPDIPRAYVILIANEFLKFPDQAMRAEDIASLIDVPRGDHPFNRVRSLIYRMRPGETVYGQARMVWTALPANQ